MKFQLAIFDLDGTLLDSVADIASSTNYALQKLGFPIHPVAAYKSFVGNGIAKLFERALPEQHRNIENIERMRPLFKAWYADHMTESTRPFAGLPKLLRDLHSKGIKLAVASNKYHEATCDLVAHFFPELPFVAVLGHREGYAPKPDPSIVNEILALSKVPAQATLYIGDSGVDMQTALNSGTTACGVSWGLRPRNELESFQPQFMVDTIDQLRELLLAD